MIPTRSVFRKRVVPTIVALLLVTSTLSAVAAGIGAASEGAESNAATSVTIETIQTPEGESTASPYEGETVTTSGVVTAVNEDGFFLQDGTGTYTGVYVVGSATVSAGDQIDVTGLVEEAYGLTRINASVAEGSVTVTGQATVPAAHAVATANVSHEAYEGVLVSVSNVSVTGAPSEATYGEWFVDDGSGEARIDDVTVANVSAPATAGGTIDRLVGPVFFSYDHFKIQPKAIEGYEAPESDDDGSDDTRIDGTRLTILSYNDVQTAASNPTTMGRLVGAITARRAAIDNPTIVIGGGDEVSPSSLSPVSNWTVPIRTLNVIDPAAEVVGNHDLDYGFGPVENFSDASEFPWLVANVRQTDADGGNVPGTKNYTIVERGNLTIGVVGLVDEAIKSKTAVDFDEQGYEVTDFVAAGDRIATTLKEEKNVDVVVAAAHIGVPEAKELARNADDVDVVVTGDDEVLFGPEVVDGTVVVESRARGEYVGEVNLTVGDDAVAFEGGRQIELGEDSSVPINETAAGIVNESRSEYLSTIAGRTTVPLDSTFGSNYAEETRWGNLVTDAFIAQTGADVAITNAGGIRGNFVMEPGNVTYDDVYTSLPFGNYLVTKELTGEQLQELLASQVTRLDNRYGGQAQLQVSGVTYEFVDRPGADRKVTDVYAEGEPLDPDATYEVTLNSYMAGWTFGDRYGWNVSDAPTVDTDYTLYGTAAVEYVEANSPISPPGVDRIRRVTRSLDDAGVTADGDAVRLSFDAPETLTDLRPATFRVENETSGFVNAHDAWVADDTLVVTVDAAAIRSLDESSETLQVYGAYNDSAWNGERNGFDHSTLNGDVELANGSVDGTLPAQYERADDGNDVLDLVEVQTAIVDWANDEGPDPDLAAVQNLIQVWAQNAPVGA